MAAAPNAMPNNPVSPSATPRSPTQPVGSAGMPNHPNGSQVRNTQVESVQQRSTFVQAPNMAGAQQPAVEQPTSSIPPRSGMAGNPSVPHIGVQSTSAPSGTAGKQPDSHSAPARDTAGMVRGRSNRAVRRIRQYPVQQEHSARPSAGVIPSPCSRRRAFPRMETPRSRSRTMFQPSSPAARCSHPAESVWMAAPQIGSILHPQCRYLRQRRLPTAKLVHLRARPRGLM